MEYFVDQEELGVKYYYTSPYIICLFKNDVIRRRHVAAGRAVLNFLQEFQYGSGTSKINVPKAVLVEAKSENHLLELMGLHSRMYSGWIYNLRQLTRYLNVTAEGIPCPPSKLRKTIWDNIRFLVNVQDLIPGNFYQDPKY